MNRRFDQGQATRQRLVEVATRLFTERGYDDTPIPLVIEEAGVSRGALYHHFESKEALFVAVLEHVESDVADRVMRAVRGLESPVERLREACRTFLSQMAKEPVVQRIMLEEAPRVIGWERWRLQDEKYGLGSLRSAFAGMAAEGLIDADLADTLAHLLLAALDEAALVIMRSPHPDEELRRTLGAFDQMLDGLTAGRVPAG